MVSSLVNAVELLQQCTCGGFDILFIGLKYNIGYFVVPGFALSKQLREFLPGIDGL